MSFVREARPYQNKKSRSRLENLFNVSNHTIISHFMLNVALGIMSKRLVKLITFWGGLSFVREARPYLPQKSNPPRVFLVNFLQYTVLNRMSKYP